MPDHIFDPHDTTTAFRDASRWWRSIVGAIDDERWDQAALGEWSVRELVAHTDRAYKTVIDYTAGDVKDPTILYSAAGYFRTVLAEQTPHVHIANRAKQEATEREDWLAATDALAETAERLVEGLPSDAPVHTFVGEMLLDQYLATRVVELVIHGLDLSAAIDLPTPPPPVAARVALTVLLDLAVADDIGGILRLLTGRPASLPFANVLA
ncbi:MAG: hypothetical protein JWM89_1225 [Acidimicrobiales bacterium]|nr:hypothetical protein [Acidimicrobiales bacterium]